MKETKCLMPKKSTLNQTYSIEEIDIDVKRPNIDEIYDLNNNQIQVSNPVLLNKKDKVVVEQAKVTITKQTILTKSTEIKTKNIKNLKTAEVQLPQIVITDWDQTSQPIPCKEVKESISSTLEKSCNKTVEESIETAKQVSSKIVEEKTIDQFHDIDLFDQSGIGEMVAQKTAIAKSDPNNYRLEAMSIGADIKCKCCNKSTSSYSSRGSYIIVKNTQPANIQVEVFESRLDDSIEECAPSKQDNKPIFESTNYYLVNNKLDDLTDINNNESTFPNKNLEISQNVFENDEYHLSNLKKLSELKATPAEIPSEEIKNEEIKPKDPNFVAEDFVKVNRLESTAKKEQIDQFTSLNLSTYLTTGHLCCSRTSHSSIESQKEKEAKCTNLIESEDSERTVVPEIARKSENIIPDMPLNDISASHIRSDNESREIRLREQSDYFYLYVSGEKCNEIFTKGKIGLEKIFHNGSIIEAILLLTLPPSSSDIELLFELYGPNVPFDKFRVQCCIKLNRAIFEKNTKYLIKVGETKYLCTKRVEFGSKFPKHEYRFRFNKD